MGSRPIEVDAPATVLDTANRKPTDLTISVDVDSIR
jgi:hypothetical protein